MVAHGTFDPETGLYYNSKTNKWVKRLRASSSGKSKGKAYSDRVRALNIPDSIAWLPIGITKEYLEQIMDSIWCLEKPWQMDKVLATLNTYYINRYHKGYKNKHIRKDDHLYISDKQFRKWVHDTEFIHYIDALHQADILRVDYKQSPYSLKKTFKYYQINPDYLKGDKQWYKSEYESDFMKLKVYNWKEKRKKIGDVNETRKKLAIWAEELVKCFDYDTLKEDLKSFKTKGRTAEDILTITRHFIEDGLFWCNAKDDKGHRFHSPFTSIHSFLLDYLVIDGEPAGEVDIMNSQMMFFSLCFEDFNLVYPLLKDDDPDQRFRGALRTIEKYKDHEDIKRFIEWARSGIIYNQVAQRFNKSRKWAKNTMFKILFGNALQCRSAKQLISQVFPTLVELADLLNEKKLIPLMMQRVEAFMQIDNVCSALIKKGVGPFATCHDSIICKKSDIPLVKSTILEVYQNFGLPIPKLGEKK